MVYYNLHKSVALNGIKTMLNIPIANNLPSTVTLYATFWNSYNKTSRLCTSYSNFNSNSLLNRGFALQCTILEVTSSKRFEIFNAEEQNLQADSSRNGSFKYILISNNVFTSAQTAIGQSGLTTIINVNEASTNMNIGDKFIFKPGAIRFRIPYVE